MVKNFKYSSLCNPYKPKDLRFHLRHTVLGCLQDFGAAPLASLDITTHQLVGETIVVFPGAGLEGWYGVAPIPYLKSKPICLRGKSLCL